MAVAYKDYYQVLGVERGASADAITKAYKKLARQYHPDLNPNDKSAEEKFKDINEAHEVLKDPEKRRMYDQLGPDWQNGQHFGGFGGRPGGTQFTFNGQEFNASGFSDFFETLFGGRQGGRGGFGPDPFNGFTSRPRKGRDMESELVLSLEDVMAGGRRSIVVQGRELEVTIPAGIRAGTKLRLAGKGGTVPGGTPGDLFLRIAYQPHAIFQVDGENLQCDVPVAPWDAVLGGKVSVPTLEGVVELNLPAGSSSGRRMRLRGKGLGLPSARGDLMVRIMIKVPTSLNEEETKLWRTLAEKSSFTAET